MKKLFSILFFVAVALFVSQCSMDIHEIENIPGEDYNIVIPDSARTGERGTLSAELIWANDLDRNASIDFITVQVSDSIGVLVTDTFATRRELASWSLSVPEGNYDILATANMAAEKGYSVIYSEKTDLEKADAGTTLPDAACTMSTAPAESLAWFGVSRIKVTAAEHSVAQINLQRLFATVTVTMEHAPNLAVMKVEITNAAQSTNLTRRNAGDTWGLISDKTKSITLKSGVSQDSVAVCSNKYIMPTALNQANALLKVSLTLSDNSVVSAPVWAYDDGCFEAGKIYDIVLDYNTFMPPEIIIKQDGKNITGAVKENTSVDFSSVRTKPFGWAYNYAGYDEITAPEPLIYTDLAGEETSSLDGLMPGYYVVRMTYGQKSKPLYVYRIFGVTRIIVDPENNGKSQYFAE